MLSPFYQWRTPVDPLPKVTLSGTEYNQNDKSLQQGQAGHDLSGLSRWA